RGLRAPETAVVARRRGPAVRSRSAGARTVAVGRARRLGQAVGRRPGPARRHRRADRLGQARSVGQPKGGARVRTGSVSLSTRGGRRGATAPARRDSTLSLRGPGGRRPRPAGRAPAGPVAGRTDPYGRSTRASAIVFRRPRGGAAGKIEKT